MITPAAIPISTAVSILQRLHQHRAWANEKLVEAAATLSPEELRGPQGIGQGSVWQSLLHMYAAEYLWLETMHGDEDPSAIPVFG
jgi:uncharacterized damage-inducible protein DinB